MSGPDPVPARRLALIRRWHTERAELPAVGSSNPPVEDPEVMTSPTQASILPVADLRRTDIDLAGGKAANLGELTRAGFPVPPGFVLTTAAYAQFVELDDLGSRIRELAAKPLRGPDPYADAADRIAALFRAVAVPARLRQEILTAYDGLGAPPVAVRSSATAEDLAEASFAGQQDSYLNVRGAEDLIGAIRDCWASLWTARAMSYRAEHGIEPEGVRLAVVVQQMVESEAAGVMFTANPAGGHRDQVVIAAAWGLGESVVGGTVNTDNLVVDKVALDQAVLDGGHPSVMLSRTTADKTVMTVYRDRRTAEQPVPQERRRAAVLDDAAAVELAAIGVQIERHYDAPQDIEWARAGGTFFVVQSRPITALPPTEGPVPTDWPTDGEGAMYFRASIVEQLPDPLSPLFADLVSPAVSRSLQELMNELIGPGVVRPDDVSLPTVNGYAYYRYSRSGMIRLMLRSPLAMPILLRTGERGAIGRWRSHSHPRYRRSVQAWTERDLSHPEEAADTELLDGVRELLTAAAEYYTSVQTIIPIAATSEAVFSQFYDRLVRRAGEPAPSTYLLGFDSEPIRAEKSLWGLAAWALDRPALLAWLLDTPTAQVLTALGDSAGARQSSSTDLTEQREWCRRFQAHLDVFGHTVYNLDFVNAVPADEPGPLLDTLRFYLRGQGNDPHQRQRRAVERREQLSDQLRDRLGPARRRIFEALLGWAQRSAPVREDALADVGLAWPQMRRMLAELGSRLVARQLLDRPENIYWLTEGELRDLIVSRQRGAEGAGDRIATASSIEARKEVWRGQRRATPPQGLPASRWMDRMESLMPARTQRGGGNTLTGIAASAGTVTAPARVLWGPEDFGTLQPGDVLVASITTPAWTSLFAMASAVVTDIGGPLSHSSIVAREYGIPAVLGTSEATRRILSGQRITVDGDHGVVILIDETRQR